MNKPTDRDFYRSTLLSAKRLCEQIRENVPAEIVALEAGILYSRLRQRYGKRLIDHMIKRQISLEGALNKGLCRSCFQAPAVIEGDCLKCDEVYQKELRSMQERELLDELVVPKRLN